MGAGSVVELDGIDDDDTELVLIQLPIAVSGYDLRALRMREREMGFMCHLCRTAVLHAELNTTSNCHGQLYRNRFDFRQDNILE